MTNCTRCQKDVNPIHEMQVYGRVLPCCPECSNVLETRPLAVEAGLDMVQPSRPQTSPASDNGDIIKLAKARLAAIEIRVAALTQLKQEGSALRAMIAAFDAALLEEPS